MVMVMVMVMLFLCYMFLLPVGFKESSGPVRSGPVRSGPVRSGPVWSGLGELLSVRRFVTLAHFRCSTHFITSSSVVTWEGDTVQLEIQTGGSTFI
jgi:hypothetical protein